MLRLCLHTKVLEFAYKFLNSHNTLMAIDESTTIKTPTAKRTKNIIGVGKNLNIEE